MASRPPLAAATILLFVAYSVLVYRVTEDPQGGQADGSVRTGMRVWRERNCQACHQLYGLGGFMGPDLTNVADRRDSTSIKIMIQYGTQRMPPHQLSGPELTGLLAFLRRVNSTGSAVVPSGAVHWTGTYRRRAP